MSSPHGVLVFASADVVEQLIHTIDASDELTVVRRCTDLTQVRAVAQSHIAEFAVIDGEDADLETSILDELHANGIRVVILGSLAHAPRLRLIGADAVVHPRMPEQAVESLTAFVRSEQTNIPSEQSPDPCTNQVFAEAENVKVTPVVDKPGSDGKVVVTWGTSGAPGRSTVAVNVAAVLGEEHSVLLVDADTYSSSIAHMLGIPTDISGLSVASRAANRGYVDRDDLLSAAVPLSDTTHILTGISSPQRWREISPSSLSAVLKVAVAHFDWVIVDVGAATLDPINEAPRHKGTRDDLVGSLLRDADHVVLVARADAVGLGRLITTYQWWEDAGVSALMHVLINQLSAHTAGPRPINAIRQTLSPILPGHVINIVPYDDTVKVSGLHAQSVITEDPHCAFSEAIREVCGVFKHGCEEVPFVSRRQRKERDMLKRKKRHNTI